MKRIIPVVILAFAAILTANELMIDASRKIVFDEASAIPSERRAFQELSNYLTQMLGAETGKNGNENGNKIMVGYHESARSFFTKEELSGLGPEDFIIRSDRDGNIYIIGGRPRGTLYGVYWFLDRLLGVRWYTPDFEVVPKFEAKKLPALDIQEKPAFPYRRRSGMFREWSAATKGRVDPEWCARNLINDSGAHPEHVVSDNFGGEMQWSPPASCHSIFHLIPPEKYFHDHPEWWALKDGKRTHRDARGITADYCLSNPELLDAAIREIRSYLKQAPESRLISVQEGDNTLGVCECEPCRALHEQFGKKESGLWIYFTNKVAEALSGEYPDAKFITFAYTRTAATPEGIVPGKNVGVQLCVWGNARGLPYGDPRNTLGNRFIEDRLKAWCALTGNVMIWDYIYSHGNPFLQDPNPLVNIDNMKMFRKHKVWGMYAENAAGVVSNGQPFKSWLMGRAMWNPDNLDGEALLRAFCLDYYGREAGKFIAEYWKNLRNINEAQGFSDFRAGGSIGHADFESYETSMRSLGLFQDALKAAENEEYRNRVLDAFLSLQQHFLIKWKSWRNENRELPDLDSFYENAVRHATFRKREFPHGMNKLLDNLKKFHLIAKARYKASASNTYGPNEPEFGYDGLLDTGWSPGRSSGHIQVEYPEEIEIKRITTVSGHQNNIRLTYEIQGSLNGKDWFPIVGRKQATLREKAKFMFADDELPETVRARFIKTIFYGQRLKDGRNNDVGLREQFFNLKELPGELFERKPPPPGVVRLPFKADFTDPDAIFHHREGQTVDSRFYSKENQYHFATLRIAVNVPHEVLVEFACEGGAAFGMFQGSNKNRVAWNLSPREGFVTHKWTLNPIANGSLFFYNSVKKGRVIIKRIEVYPAP